MASWIRTKFDQIMDNEMLKLVTAARCVFASRHCKLRGFEDEGYQELKKKVKELNMNVNGENIFQVMRPKTKDSVNFLDLKGLSTGAPIRNIKKHVKKAMKKRTNYFYILINDGPFQTAMVRAIKKFANSNGFYFSATRWDKTAFCWF
jgi:hypothetical protein